MDEIQLNFQGQAVSQPARVNLIGIQPLGFQNHLMPVAFGKPDNLVFERRAVPCRNSLDHAAVKRALFQVFPDNAPAFRIGVSDIARPLLQGNSVRKNGKGEKRFISGMDLKRVEIDAGFFQPRRGSGFHAPELKSKRFQVAGQGMR